MGKAKLQSKRSVRGNGAGASAFRANHALVAELRAENRQLRASLRKVEKERDSYLRAVYAWVEEQVAKEDVDALLDRKTAVPLSEFIDELVAELKN